MTGIYKLKGTVKHYDWGGASFIPSLLKIENEKNLPCAEYWMGTHPQGNALIETGTNQFKNLNDYADHLPYLLKVLDVKDMLSIQVHPSKTAAEKEFAAENAAGVPIDSPKRNYKDANHKPELMVALGDFWLLHGFKPQEELTAVLTNTTELNEMLPTFQKKGYAGLYKLIMEMQQTDVNMLLQPLLDRIVPLYKKNKLKKSTADFWAARASQTFFNGKNIDRGIFSVYFFNLLHLKKGEAIFQDAGLPHAYLEGQNVEIMANSDNVLRGGLTTKHIDVKELMKHVKFQATHPNILNGEKITGKEKVFKTPAPDFRLSFFELEKGDSATIEPLIHEIILLTEGIVEVSSGDTKLVLKYGELAAALFPGTKVTLKAVEKATVYRASAPVNKSE